MPCLFLGKSLTSEILSPSCHQSKNNANATFELKENGKEYIIASPGYPLSYPFAAMWVVRWKMLFSFYVRSINGLGPSIYNVGIS